ncbi:MAG: tubulin-like doman-containing protein, partial [Fimbriiglobus sp.]
MPVRLVPGEEALPGYRLIERLGRGGFGEVWKVEAPGGIHKAIKFVFGDLDAAEEEGLPAEQELKALHRVKTIRHPYILSLERFDIVDGQLMIVMELADRNLWDRFRESRTQGHPGIPREELLSYMEETAEALDLMNNHYQIQHLDVKPQNLFLVFNHVKVADFGLAKTFEGARATVTGGVTPVYAAPETFEGWISRFTDQYSLAIVFQELLTGTRPFNGANTKQLLLQHLNSPPDLGPLPPGDRDAIGRGLSKKPDDRWPTCAEMVRALRAAGTGGGGLPGIAETTISPVVRTPAPRVSAFPPAAASPNRFAPRPVPTPTPQSLSGMPSLVTPKLVTPRAAAGGAEPNLTVQRPQVFQTGRMTSLGIAPPERTAGGVLFPALVVGVGQTGLTVLRAFRHMIREQFGSLDAVPHLRFLFVDTDPETAAAALQGREPFAPREVVVARLNRPGHYLQRDGLPPVEQWLPPGLLYKLPRNPGAAGGVRAFGRLALCDNYRTVAQRVRQEIEAFLTDDAVDKAAETTRLGVRTNRARAYLVAGTGGGTGAGMVVDLAYLVKHELRQIGYRRPDAVGLLITPPADRAAARQTVLANTYATLAEIAHFSAATRYQTRFDNAEPPIVDPDGPFTRLSLVALPNST